MNGKELVYLNHVEVVSLLKDLPLYVEMVIGRSLLDKGNKQIVDEQNDRQYSSAHLNENVHAGDRLVKAKSDGSLAIGNTSGSDLTKIRSRSLEPLTGLAMWSNESQLIELAKGDRGLGFSVLDYQVSWQC